MTNFNDQHPELEDGEIFLKNTTPGRFEVMDWKTKRMGGVAYYDDGKAIPFHSNYFPVFVQESEVDEKELESTT